MNHKIIQSKIPLLQTTIKEKEIFQKCAVPILLFPEMPNNPVRFIKGHNEEVKKIKIKKIR
jgi:hypothetical protein